MEYVYYKKNLETQAENRINKTEVFELLKGYDTWTEKKILEVLHEGNILHPTVNNIPFEYWAEEK